MRVNPVIIELFMKLCNYTCPKYNVVLVHQVMTMLGYGGYDGDNRFRQRTENTLKKRKRIRNSIEEEEAFQDFSFDEPEENEMSGSIMSKSRSRNLAGVHKKTTKSKDDHSSCLRMSEEEKTTMEVSGDCSSPVLVSSVQVSSNTGAIALPRALPTFDLDISPSYQYREEEYFSDIIDDYRCVFNRDNNVSESFYDFYDFY